MTRLKKVGFGLLLLASVGFVANIGLFYMFEDTMVPVYKYIKEKFHDREMRKMSDAYRIFNRMKSFLPVEINRHLQITVIMDPQINAWVNSSGHITLTTGMIKFADQDEGAVAAIIGHEMAHYLLAHFPIFTTYETIGVKDNTSSVWLESMADHLGVMFAKAAGYNGCNVKNLWAKLAKGQGNRLFPYSHPLPLYRAMVIERLCEKMI